MAERKSARERAEGLRQELIEKKRAHYEANNNGDSEKASVLSDEIDILNEELEKLEFIAEAEEKIDELRQFIPLGKEIVNLAKDDVVDILKTVAQLAAELGNELQPEMREFAKLHAQAIHNKYDALREVGFSSAMAIKIVLAEIKPIGFVEIMKNAAQNIKVNSQ